MQKMIVIAGMLALVGCAPTMLVRNGSNVGFDADMQACEYDAIKYGSNVDPTMRTAVGAGIEQALRQRDIKLACMQSKGWQPQRG